MAAPTEPPRRTHRSIWQNRAFRVTYACLLAGVVALASISLYYDVYPPPSSRPPSPTFTIDNVTLSLAGATPSNLTPAASWCPRCWDGSYAVASDLLVVVGIGLVPAAASCSNLGETIVYAVDTPSTGKFEIENVSWEGTSIPRSGYLPAHLPYGNASVCDSVIDLQVSVGYIPPGPVNETLSLSVDWGGATPIVP